MSGAVGRVTIATVVAAASGYLVLLLAARHLGAGGYAVFAVFWAASVAQANRLAPPGLGATAQGAVSGVMFGLGSAAGNFLGGVMYDRVGAPLLFQTAGWMLLGSLLAFLAFRLIPRRSGSPAAVEVHKP